MNIYSVFVIIVIAKQNVKKIPMYPAIYNFLSKQGLEAIIGKQINSSPGAKVT